MHDSQVGPGWADLLIQSVTDYAIFMLDPQGYVASWNAGAERFKGYTAEEIIGQHFSRFYPAEDRAAKVPEMALETARTVGRFEADGWRLRCDGSRFWASVVIDPVRTPDGELLGFAKITRDLTERRNARIALEKAQQQAFQSQKLEAIGKLTGGVAHDFNNILAAILGSLDIARRRLARGEDIQRFLDNAAQAAQRGATLTQRMLAFARRQELRLEPVDLPDCIRGMAELLERTIGPDTEIDMQFPLTLPPVRADRAQLELALLNLVVNARDAMPAGGRIHVSARPCGQEAQDHVALVVTDNGEGMDDTTLRRAVEPFFTTKGVGRGTGLGLPMVQGMAEQCGGRMILSSRPGEGTRVEILLPVANDIAPPASAPARDAFPMPQVGALRVLAVDDDPIVLLNTATMLADRGHEVFPAASGQAALDLLAVQPVDLLVTDYAMPGMSGGELVARVQRLYPQVKVIIVTGYADLSEDVAVSGGDAGEARRAGLSAPRLAKPFSETQLAAAIAARFPPPAQGPSTPLSTAPPGPVAEGGQPPLACNG